MVMLAGRLPLFCCMRHPFVPRVKVAGGLTAANVFVLLLPRNVTKSIRIPE